MIFSISSLVYPNFFSFININAILKQYSIIGFLALGQLLIILAGGIDLSQGSMVSLTSVVVAVLANSLGIYPAIAIAVMSVTFAGFLNGLMASRTKIPPFIITLGMMSILRGLSLGVSAGRHDAIKAESFTQFAKQTVLNIPVVFILFIVVSIILHFFITRRTTGLYIYATGGNSESARLSGINTRNITLFVYTLGAFLTAIGSLLWVARIGAGSPIGGVNYELESIASVLIGGGSFFGGVGTVSGTLAGVLTFGVINSTLNMSGLSLYWQGTIKGVIILIAVAISQFRIFWGKKE